nr:putative ribonuclease H-like domain-containing protein [Tanacetum cinerariifolium]
HLCSACAMGKSTKKTHELKSEDTNQEKLYLIHMDLCRLMRVESVNGKKYILVIVDDYSRFTWNGVVERRNHTLIEAACTMLIYAQAPLFLWAEAVATACFTQNRSIIRLRHGKTPYELLHSKQPDLSFFFMCLVPFVTQQVIVRMWVSYNQRLILESSLVMHRQRKLSEFITGVQDEL